MADVGPYGITQFDAAGLINNYQVAKQNRIQMMLEQKQLERMDKQAKDQEGVQKAVGAYLHPETASTASPQSATAPTGASPVSAAPSTPVSAPAAPTGADREKLISTLAVIDPAVASQYIDIFSKMDTAQAGEAAKRNAQVMQLLGGLSQLPMEQRKAAIQQEAPQLQQLGYKPEQLAAFDPSDDNLRSEMAKHMDAEKVIAFVKPDLMTVGSSVIDKNHPEQGAVFTAPTDYHQFSVHNADGTDTPYGFDPKTGKAFQLREGEGAGQASTGSHDPDSLFNALIQQESGGHPGVTGPQTKYGRSTGLTQLLPSTGKAMAEKLGVPWQPDLLTGTHRRHRTISGSLAAPTSTRACRNIPAMSAAR
jgi:hypothetical protein